jgi:hypothetical protein
MLRRRRGRPGVGCQYWASSWKTGKCVEGGLWSSESDIEVESTHPREKQEQVIQTLCPQDKLPGVDSGKDKHRSQRRLRPQHTVDRRASAPVRTHLDGPRRRNNQTRNRVDKAATRRSEEARPALGEEKKERGQTKQRALLLVFDGGAILLQGTIRAIETD